MHWTIVFRSTIVAAVCSVSAGASAVVTGDAFPEISVKHHASGTLTADSMQGKVTLVNFWATWCAACKVELKEMEDSFKAFASEKDFQVAYVSLDKDPAKAVSWFQANLKDPANMLKGLYLDSAFAAAETLKVESFPMTFIIGKDGKIVKAHAGFKEGENSTEEMTQTIERLLRQ